MSKLHALPKCLDVVCGCFKRCSYTYSACMIRPYIILNSYSYFRMVTRCMHGLKPSQHVANYLGKPIQLYYTECRAYI